MFSTRKSGRRLNGNTGWMDGYIDCPKHMHFHRVSWSETALIVTPFWRIKFQKMRVKTGPVVPFVIRDCRTDVSRSCEDFIADTKVAPCPRPTSDDGTTDRASIILADPVLLIESSQFAFKIWIFLWFVKCHLVSPNAPKINTTFEGKIWNPQ